jgi:hypothetical protein
MRQSHRKLLRSPRFARDDIFLSAISGQQRPLDKSSQIDHIALIGQDHVSSRYAVIAGGMLERSNLYSFQCMMRLLQALRSFAMTRYLMR